MSGERRDRSRFFFSTVHLIIHLYHHSLLSRRKKVGKGKLESHAKCTVYGYISVKGFAKCFGHLCLFDLRTFFLLQFFFLILLAPFLTHLSVFRSFILDAICNIYKVIVETPEMTSIYKFATRNK